MTENAKKKNGTFAKNVQVLYSITLFAVPNLLATQYADEKY